VGFVLLNLSFSVSYFADHGPFVLFLLDNVLSVDVRLLITAMIFSHSFLFPLGVYLLIYIKTRILLDQ
jgi:hypothetical protein